MRASAGSCSKAAEAVAVVDRTAETWVRAGAWVRVKSAAEVAATLDGNGMTEGLPFMPEMAQFCGKIFRVQRRADKVCIGGFRSLDRIWHLEKTRCNGAMHGECEAACLLYWHEDWLSNFIPDKQSSEAAGEIPLPPCFDATTNTYTCQMTEVPKLGHEIPYPGVGYYAQSAISGRLRIGEGKFLIRWLLDRLWLGLTVKRKQSVKTPESVSGEFNIGDMVRVRSRAEIFKTINAKGAHKGLLVTADMLRYCGKTYRITGRVNRMIDTSGKMHVLKNECYVLGGVTCAGGRLMCSREEMHYWRSAWLEKVEG